METSPTNSAEPTSSVVNVGSVEFRPDHTFDWEAYIANYHGRTRIQRLLFLASQSPALRRPCSEAALSLITSSTKDVHAYHQALAIRNTSPHHDQAALPREQRLPADTAWVESTERSNRAESQKLDLELRNYTNNLIKESIRVRRLTSLNVCDSPQKIRAEIGMMNRWHIGIWEIT